MGEALFLSSADVRGLAAADEFVDAVHEAYRQRGEGAPAKPRQTITRQEPTGMLTGYSAILPDTGVMGGYMYAAGFESGDVWFATPLFDGETGRPLAIVDGAWMNPFKTGAAGAVAVDVLARADATTLGLFGSGVQAAGQLQAVATVRDLSSVRVYSPTASHRRSFAAEFDDVLDATVTAVDSSEAVLDGADIVVTATTSSDPVFDGRRLDPGTHVTAMGQYHPDRREIDTETVARATYVVDLRDRVSQDAGAFLAAVEAGVVDEGHVYGELGDVVAGTRPGRTSESEVTVFDSGGTGLETVAGAYLLYTRAREDGIGIEVPWYGGNEMMTGRP